MGIIKEGLTIKECKRTFGGDGNVLDLNCGGGYAIVQWEEWFLLNMKYTLININFKGCKSHSSTGT